MARYYFDLKDGKRLRDRDGTVFASDAEAIAHGKTIAEHFAKERPIVAGGSELFVSIFHDAGREVAQIPIHNPEAVERDLGALDNRQSELDR